MCLINIRARQSESISAEVSAGVSLEGSKGEGVRLSPSQDNNVVVVEKDRPRVAKVNSVLSEGIWARLLGWKEIEK
jgi:hypothetical protein